MRIWDSLDVLHSHLKDVMRARFTVLALAASLRPSRGAMGQPGDRQDRAHDIPAGQRNCFPQCGIRMDCPTERGRPAGARDGCERTAAESPTGKPTINQMGAATRGARSAVACVNI